MSAPSESATSPLPCACTNISLMQLFHELKQKFPGVPDHVVSNTIEIYCHDKQACETHLHSEAKASLTHAYHASSSAAARQLNELKINIPTRCRNQPIHTHEAPKSIAVNTSKFQKPQTAILGEICIKNVEDKILNIDRNVSEEAKNEVLERENIRPVSPVTVINIDDCPIKLSEDSLSDLETSTECKIEKQPLIINEKTDDLSPPVVITKESEPENTNYKILKSNKIKSNLPERLDVIKEKKTINKEEQKSKLVEGKPVRPKTLDFIKPNPHIAFKNSLKQPESERCQSISPIPSLQQNENSSFSKDTSNDHNKSDRGYPVNLSVNVNCHMDYGHSYVDPWVKDYDSPRTVTSVNLTVCTPTSNMASPVREPRQEDGGFEGHVTVTVSPSTARAPRRPAPPRPVHLTSPLPTRPAPEPPRQQSNEGSLIERQKERLTRLARALAQEKGRLVQLTRETRILAAPPPSPVATQRLREHVERLRDQCDSLAKRLEMVGAEREDSQNFYSNIYTGQRPPSSWQCHMCTFRNHPLLDKCEECDMPRIFVVRSTDGITVRLMPGRRKFIRSWIL